MAGLQAWITDKDTNQSAKVDDDGSLVVFNKRLATLPYSRYLTIDGTESGSYQMAITTGTLAAPIKFYVSASSTYNTLITQMKFFISGAAATLNEFGTGTALTNGCRVYYTDPSLGEISLKPVIYSNYDLVRFAGGQPAFGSGASAYQISNAIGTAEAFHPVVDLSKFMPNGKGIFLEKKSKQKLIIEIRDNTLTGKAVDFNCIVDGEQFL